MQVAPKTIDPELLALLRCPVALHNARAADAGLLSVVRDGWWLHCAESGCNYPVFEGIPQMMVALGQRWAGTPVDALPVPPTAEHVAVALSQGMNTKADDQENL